MLMSKKVTNVKSPLAATMGSMISLLLLIQFSAFASSRETSIEVTGPAGRHNTSFAIVIDRQTFDQTAPAVMAYSRMLEQEKLSVYVVVGDWQRPCEVRQELRKLYQGKPSLEGAVFIGNVPVAMIRKAQHLTTAFKMNEEMFPRQQSSVASDRFYDDFDLKFEYLEQDEEKPLWHYYELSHDSPQYISSDIYSGRIMPVENGVDPYQQINAYLEKVVRLRRQPNALNDVFTYLGTNSLSNCLNAWNSDKIALSQQFPVLNKPGSSFRHLSHHMIADIKTSLVNELQRDELDLALLKHHGVINSQALNEEFPTNRYPEYVFRIQRALHNIQIRDTSRRVKEAQARNLGIPVEWLDHSEFTGESIHPAELEAQKNLTFTEISRVRPNARLILLDACFTGSFHHPDNAAGAYIFNEGNTLAVIGNSVNVLQDNIPHRYLGLLSSGARIGLLRQFAHSLESHIMGDPTFYFTHPSSAELNKQIVSHRSKPAHWRRMLKSPEPDMQAFALMMLGQQNISGYSDLLLSTYRTSPHYSVRLECLEQLRRLDDDNFRQVLFLTANDPYELIRRLGANYMGQKGAAAYIPLLVHSALSEPYNLRSAVFASRNALQCFEPAAVMAEINKQARERAHLQMNEEATAALLEHFENSSGFKNQGIDNILDQQLEEDKRCNFIRFQRLDLLHHHVDKLLAVAADPGESERIRVTMIEALGWFATSLYKPQILECCMTIASDESNPAPVRNEAEKTMRRLGKGSPWAA